MCLDFMLLYWCIPVFVQDLWKTREAPSPLKLEELFPASDGSLESQLALDGQGQPEGQATASRALGLTNPNVVGLCLTHMLLTLGLFPTKHIRGNGRFEILMVTMPSLSLPWKQEHKK